jgi:hypothetical protein
MYVTYAPEGEEAQRWEFDPRKVRASRAEMIERRAGQNWDVWLQSVQSGNMKARRVLLWHLMSMPHPTMRFEDTPDFLAGEVEISHSVAELVEMRERTVKAGLPEEQIAPALAAIDFELEEARQRAAADRRVIQGEALDVAEGAPEGKAHSKNGDSSTRSRSPKSSA